MAIHTGRKNASFMKVTAMLPILCFVWKHVWCELEGKETERQREQERERYRDTVRKGGKQAAFIDSSHQAAALRTVRFTFRNMAGCSIDLCCPGVLTVKKAVPVCTLYYRYCQRTLARYH